MSHISVIVPVYNEKPYLKFCLDSILSQTYRDFDLFLIDDGSTDGSEAICDAYRAMDARITVVHQPNRGLSAARNTGIDLAFSHSDSQWLTFIDSDDYVREDYLEVLLHTAEQNHVLISSGARVRVFSHGAVNRSSGHKEKAVAPDEFYLTTRDYRSVSTVSAWGRLYAKSLFREIRFPEGKLFEDQFTTYKLFFLCDKLAVTDEVIYYYFFNPKGIVNSPWHPDKLAAYEALEQQLAFFRNIQAVNAYNVTVRIYIGVLVRDIKKIEKQPEYDSYRMDFQKKLQSLLKKYAHRLGFTPENRYDAFHSAYPLGTNLFFKTLKVLKRLQLDEIAKCIPAEWEMRIARKHPEDVKREFLVDTKNHTVYLVNCKVANTSIKAAMYEKQYPDDYSVHHIHDEGYLKRAFSLTDEEKGWDSFTFVRNPYERLVSAYESKCHKDVEMGISGKPFAWYLHGYLTRDRGFDSFAKRVCRIPDSILDWHINSQYLLTHYPDGKPVVRWIGRYENLTEEFAKIAKKYGYRSLPHYNNSGGAKRDWRTYYTPRTAKLVYRKYKKDFEAFGYEDSYTKLMEYFRNKHR